jgi:hypothetical protein
VKWGLRDLRNEPFFQMHYVCSPTLGDGIHWQVIAKQNRRNERFFFYLNLNLTAGYHPSAKVLFLVDKGLKTLTVKKGSEV